MARAIQIIKQNGQIAGKEAFTISLENLLKLIPNGEHVLEISKAVKPRSSNQNRLMWLWFTCIEHETGTDKHDIHDYYCMKFLTRIAIINGTEQKIYSGTSKLNKDSMTDFLNKVQADAASEFGIELPMPDSLYWKEFLNHYERYL